VCPLLRTENPCELVVIEPPVGKTNSRAVGWESVASHARVHRADGKKKVGMGLKSVRPLRMRRRLMALTEKVNEILENLHENLDAI
jgi:hypothetical protein